VRYLVFSPDGLRLSSSSFDGTYTEEHVYIWNCCTGGRVATRTLHVPEHAVKALAYRQPESAIWFELTCGAITCWDTHGSEPRQVALVGDRPLGQVGSAAFDRSGTRLATVHDDGTTRVWDATSGAQLACCFDDKFNTVLVALSPDGTRVARFDSGGRVLVRELTSDGQPQGADSVLAGLECSSGRSPPVFSPDNTRVAAGFGEDGAVLLWDVTTRKLLHVLNGHEGLVRSIAFSPGGARLATGSEDGTVRLWDPDTGDELLVLRGHKGFVYTVAFSPDGTLLASSSADGTIRLWDSVPFRERYAEAIRDRAGPEPGSRMSIVP
jgi:WD40 repeat protein